MTMTMQYVQEQEEGSRLDRWLKRHFPHLPQAWFENAIRRGHIRLEGQKTRANVRLVLGACIQLPKRLAETSRGALPEKKISPRLAPKDITFVRALVLHKDKHIIVINKPAGLSTQGGRGAHYNVDYLLDGLTFDAHERPRLIHRLDKGTSGLLVLARTLKAARHLGTVLLTGQMHKVYWALSSGNIVSDKGRIDLPLVKEGGVNTPHAYVKPDPEGKHPRSKPASTEYIVLYRHAWGTIVSLKPHHGRTHQIRVHLKAFNAPIVGDARYGFRYNPEDKSRFGSQLYLHARQLAFPHPDGSMFTITAPLPFHMAHVFQKMGFIGDFSS